MSRGGKREGAGRPAFLTPPLTRVCVMLDAPTLRKVEGIMRREGIKRSEAIRKLIRRAK